MKKHRIPNLRMLLFQVGLDTRVCNDCADWLACYRAMNGELTYSGARPCTIAGQLAAYCWFKIICSVSLLCS